MKPFEEQLNEVIVDTYRSILRVEENILKRSDQTDLSISEIHMLEAVGKGKDRRRTISELAEVLNITLPSVTVAINKLMKKGYVEKVRGEEDGRIVYVSLTRQGRRIDSAHRYIHGAQHHPRHDRIGDAGTVQRGYETGCLFKGAAEVAAIWKGGNGPENV